MPECTASICATPCMSVHSAYLQEASIFVFEKKQLERFSRRDRDIVLDVIKKGVSQLTRLRHPKILSILHPLEDSRLFTLMISYAIHCLQCIPISCAVAHCLYWCILASRSRLLAFRQIMLCYLQQRIHIIDLRGVVTSENLLPIILRRLLLGKP